MRANGEGCRRGLRRQAARPAVHARIAFRHAPDPRVTDPPTLHGQTAVLVPVAAEHVPELRRILATPQARARWRDEDASPQWPFDDGSVTRFAVTLGGAVRGMVQYGEEDDSDYRHASIDIFLDPAIHGRGVGRDAVATLAIYLVRTRAHIGS